MLMITIARVLLVAGLTILPCVTLAAAWRASKSFLLETATKVDEKINTGEHMTSHDMRKHVEAIKRRP